MDRDELLYGFIFRAQLAQQIASLTNLHLPDARLMPTRMFHRGSGQQLRLLTDFAGGLASRSTGLRPGSSINTAPIRRRHRQFEPR